jgi:hypothetical protein
MPPTSFSADRVSAGFTRRNALGAGVASDENASIQGVKSAAALPFFQKYTGGAVHARNFASGFCSPPRAAVTLLLSMIAFRYSMR